MERRRSQLPIRISSPLPLCRLETRLRTEKVKKWEKGKDTTDWPQNEHNFTILCIWGIYNSGKNTNYHYRYIISFHEKSFQMFYQSRKYMIAISVANDKYRSLQSNPNIQDTGAFPTDTLQVSRLEVTEQTMLILFSMTNSSEAYGRSRGIHFRGFEGTFHRFLTTESPIHDLHFP